MVRNNHSLVKYLLFIKKRWRMPDNSDDDDKITKSGFEK